MTTELRNRIEETVQNINIQSRFLKLYYEGKLSKEETVKTLIEIEKESEEINGTKTIEMFSNWINELPEDYTKTLRIHSSGSYYTNMRSVDGILYNFVDDEREDVDGEITNLISSLLKNY